MHRFTTIAMQRYVFRMYNLGCIIKCFKGFIDRLNVRIDIELLVIYLFLVVFLKWCLSVISSSGFAIVIYSVRQKNASLQPLGPMP